MSPLWSLGGVAAELRVSRQTVANWRIRYDDTPEPRHYVIENDYSATGVPLWDVDDLEAWREWQVLHAGRRRRSGRR